VLDVTLWGAFIAGLISFVSPCVLPIVPPYLCFLAGVSIDQLTEGEGGVGTPGIARNVFSSAFAFVLGFTTVFVMLGATASIFGQALREALAWTITVGPLDINVIAAVAGLIIIVMGLHFLGIFRISMLYREARVHVENKPVGLFGAYLVGLAFAFGWTPCVGPVLAAILFVAGSEDTVARGAILLATYSLGIGVPFLIAAAFAGPFLTWAKGFRRHLGRVEKVMGGLLVLTGLLFVTGQMTTLSFWLLETFPALGTVG